jgi:hypothetical protein
VFGKRKAYRVVQASSRTAEALRRYRGSDGRSSMWKMRMVACLLWWLFPLKLPSWHGIKGMLNLAIQPVACILFQSMIKRLTLDHRVDKGFSLDNLVTLSTGSPHTMSVPTVANGVPIDVAQIVLVTRTARQRQSTCKRSPSTSLKRARSILQRSTKSIWEVGLELIARLTAPCHATTDNILMNLQCLAHIN